jgi:putative inorganic carbon (HCO3(-)) transporter
MATHPERFPLSGAPASPANQAPAWLISAMAALGLMTMEGAWSDTLRQSLPIRLLRRLRRGTDRFLQPLLASSWAARLAPAFAVLSVCLLLLASPYVGTGLNALLVLLAFAAFAFKSVTHPPEDRDHTALDLPFMVMVALTLVAAAFSPYLILSVKGLSKLVVFWMAYYAFRGVLARKEAWAPVLGALLVAALVQSVYGVYQWTIDVPPLALWDDAESEIQLTRVYGTLRNPNLLGGYLIPILPLAAAAVVAFRNWAMRGLGLLTLLTGSACLYFTYSRGAWLAYAAELAVLGVAGLAWAWPAIKRDWRLKLGLGIVAVVALGAAAYMFMDSPVLQQRVASMFATRDHSSNSFRMNVWLGVIAMIQDSWWAGVGIGNETFQKVYGLYMISGFEALGAYNIFLEVAVETGIFGLLAFLWVVLAASARSTFHALRGEARPWAVAAIAGLLGLMVHGLVDTVFYRPSIQILFWLLLAMIIRLPVAAQGERA